MKNSVKLARQLIVLALATVFLANSIAIHAYVASGPFKEKTRAAADPGRSSSLPASSETVKRNAALAGEAYGKLPLTFEANRGQTDAQVKFLSRGPGYNLFLTSTEAVFELI